MIGDDADAYYDEIAEERYRARQEAASDLDAYWHGLRDENSANYWRSLA